MMHEDYFYDVLAVLTRIAEALEGIDGKLFNASKMLNEDTEESAIRTINTEEI